MRQVRLALTLSTCVWVVGGVLSAAPPTPVEMLRFQPKQPGVIMSTPTEAEAASYKVDLVNGPGKASGWALKDQRGNIVRKFVANKGATSKIDTWSYYLDGQEVYREIDTTESGKPDQFRWYGAGGMRWGVDVNKDFKIDGWKMISAEEVSQEVLRALITKDVSRFQALLVNDAELKALEFGQPEADKIRQSVAQASAKFDQTAKALNLSEKVQWLHLDVQPPQCIPADAVGGKQDIFRYGTASALYQNGDKSDYINLGELIQVGRAWRVTAGPIPGAPEPPVVAGGSTTTPTIPTAARPVMTKLEELDRTAPAMGATGSAVAKYNMARAALLEQLTAAIPGKDGEQWVKQLADCLATAAQNDPDAKAPLLRLVQLEKDQPKGPLTAYIAYRAVNAEHMPKLQSAKGNDFIKAQDAMCEALKAYVAKFKDSEDAPDAAMQIANVSEFAGKENDAKTWYANFVKDYPQHPMAAKASGALKRLALEGQPLELVGPMFGGGQFNIGQLKGKVVVTFYWATWNGQAASDFAKLAAFHKTYNKDGMELVTINLDDNQQHPLALQTLQKAQSPGFHLVGDGGLNGKLASDYGIMVLPNIFLVGKDGKVVSRTVQMNSLEDEIKKLLESK